MIIELNCVVSGVVTCKQKISALEGINSSAAELVLHPPALKKYERHVTHRRRRSLRVFLSGRAAVTKVNSRMTVN